MAKDELVRQPDPKVLAQAEQLLRDHMAQASRPLHRHTCPDGHFWLCPSPYCEDVTTRPRRCPGHGGEYPKDTRPEDFGA